MVYYARGIGKYRDSIGKREGGGSGGGGGTGRDHGNMDDAVSVGRFKDRRIRSFKRTRVEMAINHRY